MSGELPASDTKFDEVTSPCPYVSDSAWAVMQKLIKPEIPDGLKEDLETLANMEAARAQNRGLESNG